MILVDANLLLYAYDTSSEHHEPARRWLEDVLSRADPVGLAWATILAFLRIGTHSRVFEHPLSPKEATTIVGQWLSRPNVGILGPTERHWEILGALIVNAQARGSLIPDAHLAALAIEHGAVLFTADLDFSRFEDLQTDDPLRG